MNLHLSKSCSDFSAQQQQQLKNNRKNDNVNKIIISASSSNIAINKKKNFKYFYRVRSAVNLFTKKSKSFTNVEEVLRQGPVAHIDDNELLSSSSPSSRCSTNNLASSSNFLRVPPLHKVPSEAYFNYSNDFLSEEVKIGSTSSVGLSIRSAPATPMSPLQGHSESHLTTSNQGQSAVSLNAISRSPSHSSNKSDSKSLKQLSTSPPNNNRSISPSQGSSSKAGKNDSQNEKDGGKNEKEPKEKKRKELSSSRQKKFHRHFQQVDIDEKVINYYSCALVSDILLQGHLYITNNYFAFYSNVFGYVTKLLIPTVSVVKISKEKTGKIFPNAVGVTTADERHVFGSFMSREAAYRLMLSVCRPATDELLGREIEILPKSSLPDVEISSIEDDSSCSVSGNESPPRVGSHHIETSSNENSPAGSGSATAGIDSVCFEGNSSNGAGHRFPDGEQESSTGLPENLMQATNVLPLPPNVAPSPGSTIGHQHNTATSSSTSSAITKQQLKFSLSKILTFKFPTDVHIVYLGFILAVILSLFSGFLLYKIQDIQARTSGYSALDFKLGGNARDFDVYAEVLRWQREMQEKSTEEAQSILSSNLEQIARVRKSLETLSLLIHDKNSPIVQAANSNAPLNSYYSDDHET